MVREYTNKKAGEIMKRMSIIVSLAFLFLGSITLYSKSPLIFSLEDTKTKILGINLDMDQQDVEKIIGKPRKITKQYEDAFGADVRNDSYDFGEIRFEPGDGDSYYVAGISIIKPDIAGPRSIKVGQNIQEVLNKFPYDKAAMKEKTGALQRQYVYGKLKNSWNELAENNGYIEFDRKGTPIAVRYYYSYYYLSLDIQKGKVRAISLGAHNN